MNIYAHYLSLFDFTNFSDDPIIDLQSSFGSLIRPLSDSNDSDHGDGGNKRIESPPKNRHDRTSPLPFGMDCEEEDKLNVDTSSPSDALDLLTTSDNRIGLLLAEAQLLAQDVENLVARPEESHKMKDDDKRTDDELRKMITDMFVDNARLRKQVNLVVRCALDTYVKTDEDEEDISLSKTVLSKFL
ncbi:hypothetical protein V6N11_048951 [Hibiscus sabdariffa]|uniref:Uncharacterized protein n=1 Tax=Hibiscus sabdariffa TaxID=183260 RepID=A0ABR2PWR0_9ROSI